MILLIIMLINAFSAWKHLFQIHVIVLIVSTIQNVVYHVALTQQFWIIQDQLLQAFLPVYEEIQFQVYVWFPRFSIICSKNPNMTGLNCLIFNDLRQREKQIITDNVHVEENCILRSRKWSGVSLLNLMTLTIFFSFLTLEFVFFRISFLYPFFII